MLKINVRRLSGMGAVVALATLPLWAFAAAEPEDIIKYRQNVMKSNGAHMAAIGAIISGKVDYKGHLADHARAVQAINKDIPGLFPKDSDFGDTKALDGVWSKRADFEKRAKDTKDKSEALVKSVAGGDNKAIGAKFKELQDSCKACHKDYRKEEK
jgi:cytochrome c556